MVASDDITLLIHAQAAVSVTIEGKANVQTLLHHELLQTLNMRRASIGVDVRAIRFVIYDIGISTQGIRRLAFVPPYSVFCSISFRCGGLSIERNQKPLTPEITPERNAP